MRIELTARVPGVAPDVALAWWSDFREGAHDHRFVPGQTRRLEREPDGAVTMHDEARVIGLRVFRERTTARVVGNAVAFTGTNTFAQFEGRYTFEPHDGGTRIRLKADIRLHPRLAWSAVAARPIARAILRADLAGHAREMRAELGERD